EMPHRVAVVAAEPVTPVVATAAVLRLPRHRVEVAVIGPDAQVAAGHADALAGLRRLDASATIAVGDIDPVVESPRQRVDAMLLVPLDEAGIEDNFLVRLAVAVGVLGVEDLGGGRHNDALAPRHDTGRETDFVEEDRRLVVLAVTFGAFEKLDASPGLALAVYTERIVAHLDDPELAVRTPGEADRILHQRLRHDQFGDETGPRLQGPQGLLRRLRLGFDVLQ